MAPHSAVWLHCTKKKLANKTEVTCNTCKKSFAWLGTTSTLITHLEKAHNIKVPKPSVAKKRKSDSNLSDSAGADSDPDSPDPVDRTNNDGAGTSEADGDEPRSSPNFASAPQGTLESFWKEMNSFQEGARHEEITDALIYMIAHDDMPLRTTERKGFRVFTKKLNPRYKLPSEPTTTKRLHQKFKKLRSRVKETLKSQKNLTLTLDIWTNKNTMKSFLGLTAHFLQNITMKSFELTARPLTQRKTIDNLKVVIESMCEEWGINPDHVAAVITDGGANIKGAVKAVFGNHKHISCFGHILNLIGTKAIGLYNKNSRPSEQENDEIEPELPENESDIEEGEEEVIILARGHQAARPANTDPGQQTGELLKKVKKIVTFFRHSDVATSELERVQLEGTNKKFHEVLKLIQECRTLWNSAYEMADRFLQLSDAVSRVLMKVQREKSSKAKPPEMLSGYELDVLTEARDVLKPLAQATIETSADKTVTINKVIPLVNLMKEEIEKFLPTSGVGFNLKEMHLTDIQTNFGNVELVKMYAVATLLDPRFKKVPFKNPVALANTITYVGDLIKAKLAEKEDAAGEETEIPAVGPSPGNEDDDLWSSLDSAVQTKNRQVRPQAGGMPNELQRYLDAPNCNRKKSPNPFEYSKSVQGQYPIVCEVAREALSVVVTSTPCERLFSHAGRILHQLRCRLLGKRVNELVFLKSVSEEDWFAE